MTPAPFSALLTCSSFIAHRSSLMKYWLMKSEPSAYSIDDLKRDGSTSWNGVRNFQARNYMRDDMKVGDKVLFYASNADPSGVTGIAEVSREARPEPEEPTWSMVDIKFVEKLKRLVPLDELKQTKGLEEMVVTKKGSRLSVQPVTKAEFEIVRKLGNRAS
jgi:predicted RNA-binding protein with PUA-like domain